LSAVDICVLHCAALLLPCNAAGTLCYSVVAVAAPPASNSAPTETETLLVLAPGFTVGPKDFQTLGEAVQVGLGLKVVGYKQHQVFLFVFAHDKHNVARITHILVSIRDDSTTFVSNRFFLQAQCPDVRLWVACMNLDYQGIMAAMMKENPGTSYEQVRPLTSVLLQCTVMLFKAAAAAAAAAASVQFPIEEAQSVCSCSHRLPPAAVCFVC
jgi:hypothetical protein